MTKLTYRYVALTDVGLRRSNNQDSAFASPHMFALADGMGGAAAGDLASSEVITVLRQLDREIAGDALSALDRVVDQANQRLGELIAADPAVEGMGTTLEAMVFDGEKLAVVHVGDSRAYRLRDGVLTQLSTDHTFVQSLVDEGKISLEEARVHPHRSLLLKAMLGRDDNETDLSWIQPAEGDRYLLCSDGLSDMISGEQIESCLRMETIDVAATELVRLALEAGGHDNVTVVITEFVPADAPVAEDLSCANGEPQLVGAVASAPRPRTEKAPTPVADKQPRKFRAAKSETGPDEEPDPEALRYAPQSPGKYRWVSWVLTPLLLAGIIGGGGYLFYQWTQNQYFVAEADGNVAIYRGIQADIPGVSFNSVDEITDIEIDQLPSYQQGRVSRGIDASSRDDAEQIVANLHASLPGDTNDPLVVETGDTDTDSATDTEPAEAETP